MQDLIPVKEEMFGLREILPRTKILFECPALNCPQRHQIRSGFGSKLRKERVKKRQCD
jgi:hypothetical protein